MTDSKTVEALKAERAELVTANNAAPGWGAAVGARNERIRGIDATLAALAGESAEPVAWACSPPEWINPEPSFFVSQEETAIFYTERGWGVVPLYASPPDTALAVVRNDDAKFSEIVTKDASTSSRDMGSRRVESLHPVYGGSDAIGFRIWDGPDTALAEARAEIERLTEALEIIAGRKQCVDNLMSNKDIALAALRARSEPKP